MLGDPPRAGSLAIRPRLVTSAGYVPCSRGHGQCVVLRTMVRVITPDGAGDPDRLGGLGRKEWRDLGDLLNFTGKRCRRMCLADSVRWYPHGVLAWPFTDHVQLFVPRGACLKVTAPQY